jgi:hypothetical protein
VSTLQLAWSDALKDKKFIYEFLGALIFLVITMMFFARFVQFVEVRPGIRLHDGFLDSFQAINLTWPIFILIYGAIIGAVSLLVLTPRDLIILFEAYALMVIIRTVMMYFVPLEPPEGMILLQDPLVELFGSTKTLTKDLFFSGHTASLCLLTLTVPRRYKWIFLAITISVALAVLLQKIHYSIDVLVAPFISLGCYYLTSRLHKKLIHV